MYFVGKIYGDVDHVDERHRHRYEVNPVYVPELEKKGMKFPGQSEDGDRMEIMELDDHPFYVAVQYHPEYISRPNKPSPPYLGLILASTGKLQSFLECKTTSYYYKLENLAVSSANMLCLNEPSLE
jgi:CTP synthase